MSNIAQLQTGLAEIAAKTSTERDLTIQGRTALIDYVSNFRTELTAYIDKTARDMMEAIDQSFSDRAAALDEINHGPVQLKEAAE
jgi:hypothetical protein